MLRAPTYSNGFSLVYKYILNNLKWCGVISYFSWASHYVYDMPYGKVVILAGADRGIRKVMFSAKFWTSWIIGGA